MWVEVVSFFIFFFGQGWVEDFVNSYVTIIWRQGKEKSRMELKYVVEFIMIIMTRWKFGIFKVSK